MKWNCSNNGLLKIYGISGGVILILGPLSRKFEFIPVFIGDALCTVMVFVVIRCLMLQSRIIIIGALSLLISFLVEISQLYKAAWIIAIRNTSIGGMILGRGFRWDDMLVYTLAAIFCTIAGFMVEKKLFDIR